MYLAKKEHNLGDESRESRKDVGMPPESQPLRATSKRMALGLCRICSHEGESDLCDDTVAGNPARVFALSPQKGSLRGELYERRRECV